MPDHDPPNHDYDPERHSHSQSLSRGNIFDSAAPATGEHLETLAQLRGTKIERIVSSATPETTLYDQEQDEWVVLVRGQARLEVAGRELDLAPGDYVLLPAHTPHRVLSTAPGTLWLAVHVARSISNED